MSLVCESCGTEIVYEDSRYCLTHGEYCIWCAIDNQGSCKSDECNVDSSGLMKVPF